MRPMVEKNIQSPILPTRAQEVLGDIVDLYTQTGEPVGSKVLVERSREKLSSASIRNVMADLESLGLLSSPHTSAGRVPTEDGYRYYVKNLVQANPLDAKMRGEIDRAVLTGKPINEVMKDVSTTLSQLTSCAGLVMAPRAEEMTLEQIEFVRLGGDRVLVVVVSQTGDIQNRIINVPAHISLDELKRASLDLKKFVAGHTLDDARTNLISAIAEQKGAINAMMDQMMLAAAEFAKPTVADGAMVVAGSTNLFQYPELVRDRLKSLIKMFEEKRLLVGLMEEVRGAQGVQIFIGKDCAVEAASECAVIAAPYGNSNNAHTLGTLGVIGPLRMNYTQTIGVVDYTAKLLSKAIGGIEKGEHHA